MEDLKVVVQKNGSGLRIYFDVILRKFLGLKENDEFQIEMKTVKGVKTIILREVE